MKEIERLLEKVKTGNFDNQIIPLLADALETLNLELNRAKAEIATQTLLKNEAYDEKRKLAKDLTSLTQENNALKKAICHVYKFAEETLNSI